jgi:hypothetical protein
MWPAFPSNVHFTLHNFETLAPIDFPCAEWQETLCRVLCYCYYTTIRTCQPATQPTRSLSVLHTARRNSIVRMFLRQVLGNTQETDGNIWKIDDALKFSSSFVVFGSGVTQDSILLRYSAASTCNSIPKYRGQRTDFILNRHFYPFRWRHYVSPKRRDPITHWRQRHIPEEWNPFLSPNHNKLKATFHYVITKKF